MKIQSIVKSFLTTTVIAITVAATASPPIEIPRQYQEKAPHYVQLKSTAETNGTVRVMAKLRSSRNSAPGQSTGATFGQAIRAIKSKGIKEQKVIKSAHIAVYEVNEKQLDELIQASEVDHVQEDEALPPDLNLSTNHINLPAAHSIGFDGTNTAIAVLDTGIDSMHPAFGGRVVEEACFSSNSSNSTSLCPGGSESYVASGAGEDCTSTNIASCDHGTHVAGIAAGSNGVASGANIVSVQVFSQFPATYAGCNGSPCILSYASDQLAALEWIRNSAQTPNIAAVNISIGGGSHTSACNSDVRATSVSALRSSGIATVISSGNSGYSNAVGSPGCIGNAITVGATDDNSDTVMQWSNSSPLVDILAPGAYITSADAGGSTTTKSGTSMAAPHVAGAIAVLHQIDQGSSVNQKETWLENNGVNVVDSKNSIAKPRLDFANISNFASGPTVLAAGAWSTSSYPNYSAYHTINTSSFQLTWNDAPIPSWYDEAEVRVLIIKPDNTYIRATAGLGGSYSATGLAPGQYDVRLTACYTELYDDWWQCDYRSRTSVTIN